MSKPSWSQLLKGLDDTERALSPMIGRWSNGIPGHVRAELIRVRQPVLSLLIRAGRRPVRVTPKLP